MTQDDQPERAPGGGISRDTLLLLGALTFLILAVALTFLFTPNTGQNVAPTATALANAVTPAATAPSGPYPVGGTPVAGTDGGTPVGGATGFLPTVPPYPGPGATETAAAVQGLVPTGDPNAEASPTSGAAGGALPSPTIGTDAITPTSELAQASPTTGSAYPGPVGEGTPPPVPTFNPTVVQPTAAAPTSFPTRPPTTAPSNGQQPAATVPPPSPTDDFSLEPTATAAAATPAPTVPGITTTPAAPPPPPADVLQGNVRWSTGQSPIVLRRDVQIAPGAELIIEPGVEVRLDPGVSIFVDGGRMLALGLPGQPIRFVGNTGARWSGLFGRPNSFVVLENSEVRGGGAGGTVMAVDRSELVVRSSRFSDNGGAILLTDTKLEMANSEVSGNDMPFGAALEATYGRGNFLTMRGNRFGGNRLGEGAPQVRITNTSTFETLNLAIDGNLLRGGTPNLQLVANNTLQGNVTCNGLVGDGLGFGIRTRTPQVAPNGQNPMPLLVTNNYIDEHVPPIVPVYLRFGLGRGATSEIQVDMRNNWWGEASGPYDPEQNADGRGDSVGVNIAFAPWLTQPPPCAPRS